MDENKKSEIKALHTYEADIARALRENNGSIVKIRMAEQKKNEEQSVFTNEGKEKSINFRYLLFGILLILIIVLGVIFGKNFFENRNVNKISIESKETFFTTDEQIFLSEKSFVGIESSARLLNATIQQKSKLDSINYIFIKKDSSLEGENSFLSSQEIISRLGFSMPGSLLRSLDDEMIFGSFTKNQNEPHLFLMFYTNDYDQAFAGMLEWEKELFSDLAILFNIKVDDTNKYLLDKKWDDILIENKDVRVLKNNASQNVLYYLFLDRNIFMITDDIGTINESLKRFRIESIRN